MLRILCLALLGYAHAMTMEEMISRLGTKMDMKDHAPDAAIFEESGLSIPTSFVAGRDNFTECNTTIFEIKNQAQCGSCWAVSSSEVLEDRWCISCGVPVLPNGLKKRVWFAAEYLMSCCSYCGDGCEGGYPIDAMRWFQYKGIPTGGPYGSGCGCQPYKIKPREPEHGTPACSKRCDSGYPISLAADLHKAKDHYRIKSRSVAAIQESIMTKGPVACAFTVYRNFYTWFSSKETKDKVYMKTGGGEVGGHAIKIIGWGVENGVEYWLINNSWGTDWGMGGQFKYLRGHDLGGMESQCVAADPKCANTNAYSNEIYCRKS